MRMLSDEVLVEIACDDSKMIERLNSHESTDFNPGEIDVSVMLRKF